MILPWQCSVLFDLPATALPDEFWDELVEELLAFSPAAGPYGPDDDRLHVVVSVEAELAIDAQRTAHDQVSAVVRQLAKGSATMVQELTVVPQPGVRVVAADGGS